MRHWLADRALQAPLDWLRESFVRKAAETRMNRLLQIILGDRLGL
jgi:hypothetical protein